MNFRTPAPKGQIKCFRCRAITKSREGAWQELKNQQVFLCHSCQNAPAVWSSPPLPAPKLT